MDIAKQTAPRTLSISERALSGFDGALIAVSHDQTFLQAIGLAREIGLQPSI